MKLPTITQLVELICDEQYDYDHDNGVLDTFLLDLVSQQTIKPPMPEVHKLYSSWTATTTTPLASDVQALRIAALCGRIMMGLWITSVTRERAEDENRIATLLSQLALMDHSRGDIYSTWR